MTPFGGLARPYWRRISDTEGQPQETDDDESGPADGPLYLHTPPTEAAMAKLLDHLIYQHNYTCRLSSCGDATRAIGSGPGGASLKLVRSDSRPAGRLPRFASAPPLRAGRAAEQKKS